MREETHFEGKVHQNAAITTKEHQYVLLVRDPRDEELFELPGGRLNLGEQPVQGLQRELMEEIGIEVTVRHVYHTQYVWHEREQRQNLLLMYLAYVPSIDVALRPDPKEVEEVLWVDKDSYTNVPMFKDARESLDAFFTLPI